MAVGQAMAARRQMDGVLGIYDDFAAALASDVRPHFAHTLPIGGLIRTITAPCGADG